MTKLKENTPWINGTKFENDTVNFILNKLFPNSSIVDTKIFENEKEIGILLNAKTLYKFLESNGIFWKKLKSRQLKPDEVFLIHNTLYIIEKKFQKIAGSSDEKLQTCEFKKSYYQDLCTPLNIKVKYIYLLNDWFKHPRYNDTLEWILKKNCHYYFY